MDLIPWRVSPTLERMLEPSRSPSLVILTDDAVSTGSELRSIPLLHEYGHETFIYTEGYGESKLLDYEHVPSENADGEKLDYPLVHIATQDSITNRNEQHLLRKLLQKRSPEDPYVIVTDTNAPITTAYTKNKSIVDEFTPNRPVEYTQLAEQHLIQTLDSDISVSETKNILYHRISEHHKTSGAPSDSLHDIFNFEEAPTDSPVWQIPKRLLNVGTENMNEDELAGILSPWTENNVREVASRVESILSNCGYSIEEIEKKRKEDPEPRDKNE